MNNNPIGKNTRHSGETSPQWDRSAMPSKESALNRERILEIRSRIASGFYDQQAVRLVCAHHLLASGYLNIPA